MEQLKRNKKDVSSKSNKSFIILVAMNCTGRLKFIRLIQITERRAFQLIRCTLLLHSEYGRYHCHSCSFYQEEVYNREFWSISELVNIRSFIPEDFPFFKK